MHGKDRKLLALFIFFLNINPDAKRNMPEDVSVLEEKLASVIIDDYREVAKEVEKVGLPAWATYGCKPWTILNITICRELGVPKKKRVACAAVVDIGSRAVALADDIIDKEIPITLETSYVFGDYMLGIMSLAFKHQSKGLILQEEHEALSNIVCEQQKLMFDGIRWQRDNGQLNNCSVNFEGFLENYLDKICGGLFYWTILPIGIYHRPAQKHITKIVPAVKNFARTFQLKDDIGDVLHDYKEGQLTSALFFIRDIPEELEKLKEEAKSERRLSSEEFATLFPESYQKISSRIHTEEESALQVLLAANVPVRYYDIIGLLSNNQVYRRLRARIDEEIYPKKPEFPKPYTSEEKEQVRYILQKAKRTQENLASRFVTAVAVAHERNKLAG